MEYLEDSYEYPEFDPANERLRLLDRMRTILRDGDENGALKTLWIVPEPARNEYYISMSTQRLGGYMAILSAGLRQYEDEEYLVGLAFHVSLKNGDFMYQIFTKRYGSMNLEHYVRPYDPLVTLNQRDAAADDHINNILAHTDFRPDATAQFTDLFYRIYPGLPADPTVAALVARDSAAANWQQYGEYLVGRKRGLPSPPEGTAS